MPNAKNQQTIEEILRSLLTPKEMMEEQAKKDPGLDDEIEEREPQNTQSIRY